MYLFLLSLSLLPSFNGLGMKWLFCHKPKGKKNRHVRNKKAFFSPFMSFFSPFHHPSFAASSMWPLISFLITFLSLDVYSPHLTHFIAISLYILCSTTSPLRLFHLRDVVVVVVAVAIYQYKFLILQKDREFVSKKRGKLSYQHIH